MEPSNYITAFVTTSPIASNPSTDIIEQTLHSIRCHLPRSVIHILADHPRYALSAEEKDRYAEFIGNLKFLLYRSYEPFMLHQFADFSHQVRMMRETLMSGCKTPLLLFSEHDCPLVQIENLPIPWPKICRALDRGDVEFVRFLPEPQIHPEHQYLMRGMIYPLELPLMKTVQFSARPHVATRDWYLRVLGTFGASAQCFIEDGFYTHAVRDPWEKWKMAIYNPRGNAQRSLHLDGRAGAEKFDGTQVF